MTPDYERHVTSAWILFGGLFLLLIYVIWDWFQSPYDRRRRGNGRVGRHEAARYSRRGGARVTLERPVTQIPQFRSVPTRDPPQPAPGPRAGGVDEGA